MELNGQPSHSKLMQTVKFPDGALHIITCYYLFLELAKCWSELWTCKKSALTQPCRPGNTAGNDNVPGALSGGKARFLEAIQKLDAEFSNELICCNILEYTGDWKWLWEGFQRLSKSLSIGLVGFPWKFMAEIIQSYVYMARRCFDLT